MTAASTTHLLYDGRGDWIEAVRVPAPDTSDGYRWQFKAAADLVRWLNA